VDGDPAGIIRLVYDPPLEMPAELGVRLEPGVDLEALKHGGGRNGSAGKLSHSQSLPPLSAALLSG